MLALPPAMSQLVYFRICICQKRGAKAVIHPGTGNQPGTDMRPDIMFIIINDGIKRRRINKPLFDKDCFQRLDARNAGSEGSSACAWPDE